MTFLYPLGLLGLIGIPILILIYIIKSKYAEQTVSSTFLWTLSERFLKRKKPIDKVTGIISLILQILAVTLISLALARPIIILEDAADEYCFVLDASGSMNVTDKNGQTRFDKAKKEIESIIDKSVDGSKYSLICVGDNAQVVYEQLESREQAKKMLNDTNVSFAEGDYSDALGTVQSYFENNKSIITYLVTDRWYETAENIELINVAQFTENYSLSDVTYTFIGNYLTVKGNVTSYLEDATLTLGLYVDQSSEPAFSGMFSTTKGEPEFFELGCEIDRFSQFEVRIEEGDNLALDNSIIIYNREIEEIYKTLIVSDTPFFWQSALSAITNAPIDVVATKDYDPESTGYGLYIFDSISPEKAPTDGAVWFVNPQGSVDGTGFTVQEQKVIEGGAQKAELTTSSSSMAKELTEGIRASDIYISKYVQCGRSGDFTTILSYQSLPILFAGINSYGNRQVVFGFSLHDSNLPMVMTDFLALAKNLLRYSFPDVIENVSYHVGQEMTVNVITNCESIRIDTPQGNMSYLSTDSGIAQYNIREVGTYTVTVTVSGQQRTFKIYSELPADEKNPNPLADTFSLQGEAEAGGLDGEYDPLLILLICLVVIFAADWMVYCYEKYQLR